MYWDFSGYNVVVQQVEGVSNVLHDCAKRLEPLVGEDEIAQLLLGHLRDATEQLDRRAIRMLALYDPAARQMWRDKVKFDPRRRRQTWPQPKPKKAGPLKRIAGASLPS